MASRLPHFDNWPTPTGLSIVIIVSLGYAISSAVILRRAAERARALVLQRLSTRLATLGTDSTQTADTYERLVRHLELMRRDVESMQEGAFGSITQQPWVRATLLLLGSGGTLVLLELLA